MTTLKSTIVLLLGLSLTSQIECVDFCEKIDIQKCPVADDECMKTVMEPKIREFLVEGHAEHFMEPVDPLIFHVLRVPTKEILYTFYNASLFGYRSAKLIDGHFDMKKGLLHYTYLFNFDFYAKSLNTSEGKSLLGKDELHIRLENLRVATDVDLELVKRCNDIHLKINSFLPKVSYEEDSIIVKSGLSNPDSEFLRIFPRILGEAATRKLLNNYRTLNAIYPVTMFIKIN